MAHSSRWAHIQRRIPPQGHAPPPPHSQQVRYEGYGPGGTAILIDCVTADPVRTRAELRAILARHGGHLGAPGSVCYLFNPVGLIACAPGTDRARLTVAAFEAGAEEVVGTSDGRIEVLTDPASLEAVRARLMAQGFTAEHVEVTERAWDAIPVTGEAARCMLRLLLVLKHRDDVRNLYANVEIPEEILAEL